MAVWDLKVSSDPVAAEQALFSIVILPLFLSAPDGAELPPDISRMVIAVTIQAGQKMKPAIPLTMKTISRNEAPCVNSRFFGELCCLYRMRMRPFCDDMWSVESSNFLSTHEARSDCSQLAEREASGSRRAHKQVHNQTNCHLETAVKSSVSPPIYCGWSAEIALPGPSPQPARTAAFGPICASG